MGRNAAGPVAFIARALWVGLKGLWATRRVLVPTIVVAAAMAPVFWRYYVASDDDSSDHSAHIKFIRDNKIPTYPLYHLSVKGLAKCLEIYAGQIDRFRPWFTPGPGEPGVEQKFLDWFAPESAENSPAALRARLALLSPGKDVEELPKLMKAWPEDALSDMNEVDLLRHAAAVIMTLACAATAGISAGYLASRTSASTFTLAFTCLGLALVMPFPTFTFLEHLASPSWRHPSPGHGLFLGQISPNVWHNPTTIFAMPFAVALFWVGARAVENFTLRVAVELAVVSVLSLLAKPNYALALLPCIALALAWSPYSSVDKVLRFIAAFILPAAVLWGQAAVLVGPKGDASEEMLISPFEIWERFSQNIPVSAFVGVVFPLSVLLAYHGRFSTETPLKLAWVALGMAVLQYSLLIEGGERKTAGNWGWGMMFADHMVFLASCEYVLRQRLDARKAICCAFFLAHVGLGIFSLRRCMVDPKWSVFF